MDQRLNSAYWALRIGFGATAFLAGLDKFFNILTNWEQYVSPLLSSMIPAATLMHIAGVIEMIAGLAVLAGLVRIGGYVVAAWLLSIAIALVTTGRFFDIAVRDVMLAFGSFTLARIATVREVPSALRAS